MCSAELLSHAQGGDACVAFRRKLRGLHLGSRACGKGHIAEVLKAQGHNVVSTDLNDWSYGIRGVDFLSEKQATRPAHLHQTVLRFGGLRMRLSQKPCLSCEARRARWRCFSISPRFPTANALPSGKHTLPRVSIPWTNPLPPDPNRPPPRHFTQQRYVWAVWTQDHKGPPAFWWLSAADFRARAVFSQQQ